MIMSAHVKVHFLVCSNFRRDCLLPITVAKLWHLCLKNLSSNATFFQPEGAHRDCKQTHSWICCWEESPFVMFRLRFTGAEAKTKPSVPLFSLTAMLLLVLHQPLLHHVMANLPKLGTTATDFFVKFSTESNVSFQMRITSQPETDDL